MRAVSSSVLSVVPAIVIVALAAGSTDRPAPQPKAAMTTTDATRAGFGTEPTDADPADAWPQFLATAPLDEVIVTDADIASVTTDPLTLTLTAAAADDLVDSHRDDRFVVTLDGERLYAGRIMYFASARYLRHPVIHITRHRGPTEVMLLPMIGARTDTAVNAPPALLAHFAAKR